MEPIVDRETDVTKLLNCLSLAKLALSNVEERNPDFINEALFGRIVSKSSHSTTETGTKEKSLDYCTFYLYQKRVEYSIIKASYQQLSHTLTFGMVGIRRCQQAWGSKSNQRFKRFYNLERKGKRWLI